MTVRRSVLRSTVRVRRRLRIGVAVLIAVLAGSVDPAGAHQGVRHPTVQVRPTTVAAGAEVTIVAEPYTEPLAIHLGTIAGPVLSTIAPKDPSDPHLKGVVTIPPATKAGRYALVATPSHGTAGSHAMAETLITVLAGGSSDEAGGGGGRLVPWAAAGGILLLLCGGVVASRRRRR